MKLPEILREPLVHFLLIGLGLFVLYGRVAGESADSRSIEVSREQIAGISRQFQSAWNRTPTQPEMTGLINAYIRDEVLYREGVAMGLEADDPVIKRRIRQKLEVVSEETSQQVAPTDTELNTYLRNNPDKFRLPTTVSFEQVFFSGDASIAEVEKKTTNALAALKTGTPVSGLSEATMLPASLNRTSMDVVARDFGAAFAKQLDALPLDAWQGPIASSFGAHVVRVTERMPATAPPLADVRPMVLREWENERRERNRAEAYRAMASNYRIVIDGRSAAGGAEP